MTGSRFAGVEMGGTHVVCLVGRAPEEILDRAEFPTADPGPTLARVNAFLEAAGPLDGIGIASFGPLELRPEHPHFGFITTTPKPAWSGVDVAGAIGAGRGVPVAIDTDVNAAALAEGRFGAARGLDTFVYLTVGTGIGGGAVVGVRIVHGLVHPEMGHVSVGRQPGDEYPGHCPFHADCLEALASGSAIAGRWGRGEDLTGERLRQAVELEASYLAAGLRNVVYTLAPQRIVVGGGVAAMPGLLALTAVRLTGQLNGYPGLAEQAAPDFVVSAALGDLAGPVGALLLAETAERRIRRQ